MIAEYLTEALETEDAAFIVKAVETVARAQRMTAMAEAAGVSRDDLYRALDDSSKPQSETLRKVFGALGVQMQPAVKTSLA